jgi:O-antigen/teichoic acid export membrane protein
MLIKNIYIRLGTNAFVGLIGLATSVLIFRVFGVEVVGLITYYYSLAGILSIFTDLGVSTAYNKFLAAEGQRCNIATYLFLKFVLIAVYVVIFFVVYLFKIRFSGLDKALLFILFGGFVLDLISQVVSATLVGRRDFPFLSKIEIAGSLILCGYNLVICLVIPNKYFLAGNKLVLPIVMMTAGGVYFFKKGLLGGFKLEWADMKRYIYYSLPIAFSSIVSQFTNYFDKVLLGKLLGMAEVGFYQIALRFYAVLDEFIKPVTNTMFTEIVHRVANVPSFFHRQFRDLIEILNFSGGVMVLGLVFASSAIIDVFLGAENARSAFILKFFSLAILAKLYWRPYEHIIYALEKQKWTLYPLPVQLVVMFACYYFLIPLKLDGFYLGAAAMPLTEFIIWVVPAGFIRVWILKKEYGNVYMLETILKIWLPMAVGVGAGYVFGFSLWMLPVVLLGFIAVEYCLKVLTKGRWNELVKPFNVAFLRL